MASFLKEMGVQGGERKRMLSRMGEAAEREQAEVFGGGATLRSGEEKFKPKGKIKSGRRTAKVK